VPSPLRRLRQDRWGKATRHDEPLGETLESNSAFHGANARPLTIVKGSARRALKVGIASVEVARPPGPHAPSAAFATYARR